MAEKEIKVKKDRDPIFMVCLVVFLLTVCTILGASVYNNYIRADNEIAVNGSSVSVNYTGTYYAYYGDDGHVVFDTSFWSIANDDGIIKSNDFTVNAESNYKELTFTVGGTEVLSGFGNAVIGHKVGDKIRVIIPSGEGYNAPDTDTVVSALSAVTIPVTETLTSAQFKEIYGYDLKGYEYMEKSVYGWPASASYNTSSDTVTLVYNPQSGSSYVMLDDEFGKVELNVTAVSSSTISYTYSVSNYKVVSTDGDNKEIQMIMLDFGMKKCYIKSVTDTNNDGVADTFTYKTTGERYNQDLYFEIEIVAIN